MRTDRSGGSCFQQPAKPAIALRTGKRMTMSLSMLSCSPSGEVDTSAEVR